jgi:sulfur carrier protein
VIRVNGSDSDVRPGETLEALLQRLDVPPQGRGVAVAVDGEVVPREQWSTYPLADDARVEVLSAMQGG